MRTNIEIDPRLMGQALKLSGLQTKKAAVERGLELLVHYHERLAAVSDTAGIGWEGDLDALRDGGAGPRS